MAQLVSDRSIAIDRLGRRAGTLTCGHSGGVDQRLHLQSCNSNDSKDIREGSNRNDVVLSWSMKWFKYDQVG